MTDDMWGIGTNHNTGFYLPKVQAWGDLRRLGGWDLLSLVFDAQGTLWCVGTGHNVGKWNTAGWDDQGKLGGWDLIDLTFDEQGVMWGVDTANQVGQWDSTLKPAAGWISMGRYGGWDLLCLRFGGGAVWGVGTDNNLGRIGPDGTFQPWGGRWDLLSIALDSQGTLWGVGTENNLATWNGSGWDNLGKWGGWDLLSVTFER